MKQTIKKSGFTLVELIVVITILAILGTIAFIALQGYSSDARDSRRISDIQNIKKSLELFQLNSGKYPIPDNGEIVAYSGETMRYQGIVGDNVTSNLSNNLQEKPKDPLTELEYTYATVNNRKQYELLSIYEGDMISYNRLFKKANAEYQDYPRVDGNYNGIFVRTTNFYVPTPSIMTAEDPTNLDFKTDNAAIGSQIITGGSNLPQVGTVAPKTRQLDVKLSVYEGETITSSSDDADKKALAQAIQGAYSGSFLATKPLYESILSKSGTGELVSLVDSMVLNASSGGSVASNQSSGGSVCVFDTSTFDNCTFE